MYKFYLPSGLNDVTKRYVGFIEEALDLQGIEYCMELELNKIGTDDIVLVIDIAAFNDIYKHNRTQRIVTWMQGIFPEETDMNYPRGLKQFLRKKYWKIIEKRTVLKSEFLFFVSDEMHKHYQREYGYNGKGYFVMPCFNMPLDISAFENSGKYATPSFLYAGGLNGWQCIEQTLKAYEEIHKLLPDSTFTFLTREVDQARKIAKAMGIEKIDIRSADLEQMAEEQRKMKYGFILREDVEVNRVATPTKLNSYMASGIIPIMSEVIYAFKENLSNVKYMVRVKDMNSASQIAKQIAEFEAQSIEPHDVLIDYRKVFDTFYNKDYYISKFAPLLPR